MPLLRAAVGLRVITPGLRRFLKGLLLFVGFLKNVEARLLRSRMLLGFPTGLLWLGYRQVCRSDVNLIFLMYLVTSVNG